MNYSAKSWFEIGLVFGISAIILIVLFGSNWYTAQEIADRNCKFAYSEFNLPAKAAFDYYRCSEPFEILSVLSGTEIAK